jgi:hypothetical protein
MQSTLGGFQKGFMSAKIVVLSSSSHFLHSVARSLTGQGFQITPLKQVHTSLPELKQLQADLLIWDNENDFSPLAFDLIQELKSDPEVLTALVILMIPAAYQGELPLLPAVEIIKPPLASISLLEIVRQMLAAPNGN